MTNRIREYLCAKKISIKDFGTMLGGVKFSKAQRIASGERFSRIRSDFLKVYIVTKITPNEILNIPPRNTESTKSGEV